MTRMSAATVRYKIIRNILYVNALRHHHTVTYFSEQHSISSSPAMPTITFVWFHMRLPSDIHPRMIRLRCGRLLMDLMHIHLYASEENGCRRGTIGLQRGSTTCRENFL